MHFILFERYFVREHWKFTEIVFFCFCSHSSQSFSSRTKVREYLFAYMAGFAKFVFTQKWLARCLAFIRLLCHQGVTLGVFSIMYLILVILMFRSFLNEVYLIIFSYILLASFFGIEVCADLIFLYHV